MRGAKREYQVKESAAALGQTPLEAHERVRKGISLREVIRFVEQIGLTQQEAASLLGVPLRTFQRWLSAPERKLDSTTGGRYYRAIKIMQHATTLLGSMAATLEWLRSQQRALGFRIPLELLATEPGAEAVEDLLGRIEYGVVT
ncbi:MAG: type II RES/Xre toxin-antitoxin system antitoxin [Steroidobacteraceae bacterium]